MSVLPLQGLNPSQPLELTQSCTCNACCELSIEYAAAALEAIAYRLTQMISYISCSHASCCFWMMSESPANKA